MTLRSTALQYEPICYTCNGEARMNGLGQVYCVACEQTPENRCTCAPVAKPNDAPSEEQVPQV
jgi:hypothetical protein